MATTEQLIVELDAKVGGYIDSVNKADNATKKTEKSIAEIGKTAAKAFAGMTLAAAAVATAMAAYVVNAGKSVRETERLASVAKLAAGEFQSLAFATSQYGIDAEKIADISKDLSDRLGEFATAGTGAFQDFADVTKLTKDEAAELAESWKDMSSDEVLGQMVSRMEEAGASANDMTFVMESMAGDLSQLTPLFLNNGAELDRLRSRYDKATESLNLTKKEAEGLKQSAETFDLLTTQLGKAGDKIAAVLAPVVMDFFEDVIEIVPAASQAIIDFVNNIFGLDKESKLKDLNSDLDDVNQKISELESQSDAKFNLLEVLGGDDAENAAHLIDPVKEGVAALGLELHEARSEAAQLQQAILDLNESEFEGSLSDLNTGEVDDKPEGKQGETADEEALRLEQIAKKLESIENANIEELELIQIKADAELEILRNLGASKEELALAEIELAETVAIKKSEILVKELNEKKKQEAELKKEETKRTVDKLDQQKGFLQAAGIINSALFEDNKAVNAGLIIGDTAVGIQKSLAIAPYDYANVAIIAATGVANLANNFSSSKGGGSIETPSGSGSPADIDFGNQDEDLGSLEVSTTTQSEGGGGIGQTVNVVFSVEDGDTLLEGLANGLNDRQRNG